jgi:hypothetical protein
MRIISRLLPIAFVTVALATGQDSVSVERKWKVGDSDTQRIGLALSTQMGDVAVVMMTNQNVAKTFGNGEAELHVTITDLKVIVNGAEMPAQAPPAQPVTMRLDKRGMPVQQTAQQRRGLGNEILAFAYLSPDKPLKVGEVVEISYAPEESPKTKAKGTIKLESLTDGVAKMIGKYDVWTENTGDEPMKVAITNWFRLSDGKFVKSEGTFSNFRLQPGMAPTAAQFTMELIEK